MPGYAANKPAILARIKRAEGQVRGIARMVEDERYCIEILDQVSAVNRALQEVALGLLQDHLSHCIAEALHDGDETANDKVAEASVAIARLVRS